MRLLVLGGGGFLGFHAVNEALADGHDVTVFSRTAEPPVDGVSVVIGDRQGDISGLVGREWDAVLDTFTDEAPGAPAVRRTAEALSGSVGCYAYVSGMSVYAPHGPAVPDESAALRSEGVEPETDVLQARSVAKLAGEAAVTELFDGVALYPRVGIMCGPRALRYNYWPVRIAGAVDGSLPRTVLVPGDPDRTVQYSDARDIAAWLVRMLSEGRGGTYNTVGPGRADTLRTVLDDCLASAGGGPDDVDLVAVDNENLLRHRLRDIDEEQRPLWYPEDQIPQHAIDSSAAFAAGLVFRPSWETAADTLQWARETGSAVLTDTFVGHEQDALRGFVHR